MSYTDIPWAELAKEIHAGNVARGFWGEDRLPSDSEQTAHTIHLAPHYPGDHVGFPRKERNVGELLMLVVSELVEAMEEDRAGRPARWHELTVCPTPEPRKDDKRAIERILGKLAAFYAPSLEDFAVLVRNGIAKPEGAATELADAIIRILDLLEPRSVGITEIMEDISPRALPPLSDNFSEALFWIVGRVFMAHRVATADLILGRVIWRCCELIERLGEDPEALIREKMAYNATRSFRHGKRY
ncbi:MAG: hypothetical protein M3Q39_02195 [Actinomycetota bacterium]|nr:hypothetical protein [Actinomycetota bacterium]